MSTTPYPKASKAVFLAQLQALVSGLQKELPNGSFTLLSTVVTSASLIQAFQALITALQAVDTAQAAAKAALVDFVAESTKTVPLVRALRKTLVTMFVNSPDTLAVFGLKPPKAPAARTPAEKATAAAKAKATRAARGTASKKAKAAVTGNVVGVTITPITAPAPAPEQSVSAAPAPQPPAAAPPPPPPAK